MCLQSSSFSKGFLFCSVITHLQGVSWLPHGEKDTGCPETRKTEERPRGKSLHHVPQEGFLDKAASEWRPEEGRRLSQEEREGRVCQAEGTEQDRTEV
jgi:hypothetical protein